MASSPLQGIKLPDPDDANDVPGDLATAVVGLEKLSNMRYSSTTARDAEITSPENGMECVVDSGTSASKYIYYNGKWRRLWDEAPETIVAITATADFALYNSNNPLKVSRSGDLVFFEGTLTTLKASIINGTSMVQVGTLPEEFWPRADRHIICQGSSDSKWDLAIYADGRFLAGRYSGTQAIGAWLPFNAIYRAKVPA